MTPSITTLFCVAACHSLALLAFCTAASGLNLHDNSHSNLHPGPPLDPATAEDIEALHERRLDAIMGSLKNVTSIGVWISSFGPNGQWPDVDYTTGCAAQRANWPAEIHWARLAIMAGAWHGALPGAIQYAQDSMLADKISLGMDWWFARDFTNPACLDSGGSSSCPCNSSDPTMWNTNWFSNIIGTPELVGQTCLFMNATLSAAQFRSCTHMTARAYSSFYRQVNGLGTLTGANTLDVAKIGIDNGLLTRNATLIADAFSRIHAEVTVKDSIRADGVRADGSFSQHSGILYNGNYGKDYTNDAVDVEVEAAGTQFTANQTSRSAMEVLFSGDAWMIYQNVLTGVLHWDFSVLGRFISFPVADDQATASINLNLTEIGILGQDWSSSDISQFSQSLSTNGSSANAGQLEGNRMFFTNDYMVHRGSDYVTTVKMFSTRTKNTECTNSQNPFGFHLSDGTVYNYLHGNEYEDISAAWDWNLIPGTTVDYGATPLDCAHTGFNGMHAFVGGVSDGASGIAVMQYTNPLSQSLSWQKAWFMLEGDVQHVMISGIMSSTTAPVFSVLDQKRHNGEIFVDGERLDLYGSPATKLAGSKNMFHDGVGYAIESNDTVLTLQVGPKTGDWSAIGISTQPPPTVDLFAAWIEHTSFTPASYTVFPGTNLSSFTQKSQALRVETVQNDANVSAIFDEDHNTAMMVFWQPSGGSACFSTPNTWFEAVTITANAGVVVIYNVQTGNATVSDPSQSVDSLTLTLAFHSNGETMQEAAKYDLPTGGLAGSSISQTINHTALKAASARRRRTYVEMHPVARMLSLIDRHHLYVR